MSRPRGSNGTDTGSRLRAAALTLIARHGFAAVSMRRIAAEVGVQAGALYLYTPDKQTLLFQLMRDHMDELLAAWRVLPQPGDPLARLETFARFHIRFHLDRPEEVFIAYMELRNLDPANYAEIASRRAAYEAELETILRDGVAAGVFAVPDTRLATMAVIAMLTGVNTWYRDDGRLSRHRVEAIYWDMVRGAVGG